MSNRSASVSLRWLYLFVKVTEQVERLHADIGAADRPFQEAPEIFQAVRVDFTANVFDRMVDDFMLKLVQPFVRFQCISEDFRTSKYVITISYCSAFFLVFGTTLVITLPPLFRIPMTAVLSFPPVLLMRRAFTSLCMFRALPPM